MVFATENEVESTVDTTPLSPEQVANSQAKHALLNESLGIEKDIQPQVKKQMMMKTPHASLHWTLKELQIKMLYLIVPLNNLPQIILNQYLL